ncbi:CHASE2 domain-containing protein [Alkalinema sp. FACHB-956]|uniref:CHASE2 domain-containing protein n=1 Tax=Alkalinema sp. FACHB-956 TaxID=2692768 RepID=UPI0016828BE6|nr:CHASE2 domain-containing protein [Alkalinema sp. FACHB-956]MBD2329169.1 CHASE2 domain-containing protein [Alkalinema sp. FACHB-956]
MVISSQQILLKLTGTPATGFNGEVDWDHQEKEAKPAFGQLPANLPLLASYHHWRSNYRGYGGIADYRIEEIESTSQVTLFTLKQEGKSVLKTFEHWLAAESFQPIVQWLKLELEIARREGREARILLQTDNAEIRLLPWQVWSFLQAYTHLEIAFAPITYTEIPQPPSQEELRILVILGCSDGIDTNRDRHQWMSLPNVIVELLEEPTREAFAQALQQSSWDILFFAGHSQTEQLEGFIDLNPSDRLSLEELKRTLKTAITRGLKLAIFNSCDGLGVLNTFSGLHIPQMIVMREPIPDKVAHKFLEYFLTAFSSGKSFYAAVAQAREQLEGLQDQYPCATWLPVSYQNPAIEPLRWPSPESPAKRQWWQKLGILLIMNLTLVGITYSMHSFGWLKAPELAAYDWMMRHRPNRDMPSSPIVILTIDDPQLQRQQTSGGNPSLPDHIFDPLLKKLKSLEPAVIGNLVVRDYRSSKQYSQLDTQIRKTDNLLFICSEKSGIPPALSALSQADLENRIGFSDYLDEPDTIVRRHLISQDESLNCPTTIAFSALTALRYLAATQKLPAHWLNEEGEFDPDRLTHSYLHQRPGIYQGSSTAGHQLLLHYRHQDGKIRGVFQEIPLQDFLDRANKLSLKGKIVLIGVTATTASDSAWQSTPYGSDAARQLPEVLIEAHKIQQILDHAEGLPVILTFGSSLEELIWLILWAGLGCGLVLGVKPLSWKILGVTAGIIVLTGSSLYILNQGIVASYIPALMIFALGASATAMIDRSMLRA